MPGERVDRPRRSRRSTAPFHAVAATPRFEPRLILHAWRNVPLRLANIGYLGHMWELYAMWAWFGVFLHASFAQSLPADTAPFAEQRWVLR